MFKDECSVSDETGFGICNANKNLEVASALTKSARLALHQWADVWTAAFVRFVRPKTVETEDHKEHRSLEPHSILKINMKSFLLAFTFTPTHTPIRFRQRATAVNTHQRYSTTDSTFEDDTWSLSDIPNLNHICSKFTVNVCTSTTCSNRRRTFGFDDSFLLTKLYERMEAAGAEGLRIEESQCLGHCKKAPCVSVEHDDYEGPVALEGMNPMEFNRKW